MRVWLGLVGLVCATSAYAADHIDSPSVLADPSTDIGDVFAWKQGNTLVAVVTVSPFTTDAAQFSDAALYTFHIQSQDDLLAPTSVENHELTCRFDASQTIQCWLGDEYIAGDASATAGILNGRGLKVFAGLRDDPFFFNLTGFRETVSLVNGAAASLAFDAAGCPALDAGTSTVLLTQLATEPGGATAVNDFAGANVLSLVVEIDLDLINDGGDVIGVWASTNEIGQ